MSEKIKVIDIQDEMKNSYLDYAMSVIVSRALPDVRDGLKPVHRRILYTMHEMKVFYNKPFKKSARIVGEVMGKYHPHGDAAIYNTLVRMAQPFSLRYMMVDGQGNFGSIDGDSAAAMRYSEARMTRIASEMLRDIERKTVDFIPNYDNSLFEPTVLPARIPGLLVNGSEGIAVAMSTRIPPHNLTEVLKALVDMIDNPQIEIEDLMKHIKGPDFPTGGYLYGIDGVRKAYLTGTGKAVIRARAEIKEVKNGFEQIIVTEIPYQVVKSDLVKEIAALVRDKKITEISDLIDQSGRKGMKIVVKLKKNANGRVILNQLYKMTRLQVSYHMIMLALDQGKPQVMNLKEILRAFIDHRRDVVTRRTLFNLQKAESRMHILQGYKIALSNINEVIEIIKHAQNRVSARNTLIESYQLSERQADAVLDLRLHRLTSMETQKIEDEIDSLQTEINYYNLLLSNDNELMKVIKEELEVVLAAYGDVRRTELIPAEGEISIEDLIAREQMAVTISHQNYIKRVPISIYRSQRRGGKGKIAMATKDEDFLEQLFVASSHDNLLFFTNFGKVYRLKVYELPEESRQSRGKPIVNVLQLEPGEIVETTLAIDDFKTDRFIVMMTDRGVIKKTPLSEFESIRVTGKIAIKIKDNDRLNTCSISNGANEIFVVSKQGKAIRFPEEQVRPMGRTASGVRAITLNRGDIVVNMLVIDINTEIFVASEFGYGKKTALNEYKVQKRSGKGIITMNITPKTGNLIAAMQLDQENHLMLITDSGKLVRMNLSGLSIIGRATQGVKLINLEEEERVVCAAKVADDGDDESVVTPLEGVIEGNPVAEATEESAEEVTEIVEPVDAGTDE